ncbi:prominin-1-like [Physella acuta]|uniref:prominin-1-like n=1 Tax=Physella acuta TaxID=109671 RepID=UPI0027DDA506|nr:prominin-1-like [Physella acuta]
MAHLRALLILAWFIHASTPQTHDLQNPPQLQEVKDESGNRADNKSDVHFRKISDTSTYKAHGESDVGAIGPYYKLAYGIAKASMEGEFPYELLNKTLNGTVEYEEDWKKLLDTYIGYFITVLFGVVLVIIFPIVCLGCCIYIYCCCCCKKPEPKSPREGVYRKKCCLYVTLIVLAVLIIFALVGICLMFASNEHLRDSIHELGTSDFELLDDVTTYIRSSVDQADQLVNKDFTFSRTVLNRDLQNIGGILGEDVKQKVTDRLRLQKLYDDIIALENSAYLLNVAMEDLVASRETIIREATIFLADLRPIQAEINRIQDPRFREACPNYTLNADRFNPAVLLPDESAKNRYLNRVISRGVYAMTLESSQKLNEIPKRVQTENQATTQDLSNKVANYTGVVTSIYKRFDELAKKFQSQTDIQSLKSRMKNYAKEFMEYDEQRWVIGLVISLVALLIVLPLAIWLVFGFMGFLYFVLPIVKKTRPYYCSICMQIFYIFAMIFLWVMLILTTVVFAIGAPTTKLFCEPLQSLEIIEKLIVEYKLLGTPNSTWLSDQIYPDKNVSLKLVDIIRSCSNGSTAYKAFKMKEAQVFDLTEIKDYGKTFNIGENVKKLDADFGGVQISTAEMLEFVKNMKTFDEKMQYSKYEELFRTNPYHSAEVLVLQINTFLTVHPNHAERAVINRVRDMLMGALSSHGSLMQGPILKVKDTVTAIITHTRQPTDSSLNTRTTALIEQIHYMQKNVNSTAKDALKDSLTDYELRLKNIFNNFSRHIQDSVENDIGNCKPLWNVFNTIFIYRVCHSIVGALNGWWCAMGWTILFLVSATWVAYFTTHHFFTVR